MNEKVIDFINTHEDLIDNNEWEKVYTEAERTLRYGGLGDFTYMLLEANIHPEEYLTTLPEAFLAHSEIQEFTIPSNIDFVNDWAFYDCKNLYRLVIQPGVKTIKRWAFEDCVKLRQVDMPDTITSIGSCAFQGCVGLTHCVLGDNVTNIGMEAFGNCHSLTNIVIPDTVTTIGDSAFSNCRSLSHVTIGKNVASIGYNAFRGTLISNITIPDSVTSIEGGAFAECNSIKYNEYDNACYLGNTVNPYLWLIKAKNKSITSCDIHKDAKFIGPHAFDNCRNLKSIVVPTNIIKIEERAFYDCRALKDVVISDNVKAISMEMFRNCYHLETVKIPSGVTDIGHQAFKSCGYNLNIQYEGKTSTWKEISKGAFPGTQYTVNCIDGVIKKTR